MELSTRLCCPSAKGMSSMSWSVSSPEKIWDAVHPQGGVAWVFRPDLADGEGTMSWVGPVLSQRGGAGMVRGWTRPSRSVIWTDNR